MRIAVVQHVHAGDYAEYIPALINEEARKQDYEIKSWSNSVPASQQHIGDNAVVYIIFEATSSFMLRWWYTVKLPSILKKIKAGIVVDLNGCASAAVKIPQVAVFAQELFSEHAMMLKPVYTFAAKHIKNSMTASTRVVTYSNEKLTRLQTTNPEKDLSVIPFTAPAIFKTFEWHEKIMVKARQADNKEYFIAVMEDEAEDIFVTMLRAFSKFKNWQQSSMQFLLLPKYEAFGKNIRKRFETYKYREDVRLLEELEETEIAAAMASAYALVHTWESQPDLLVLAAALQCSLPVITWHHADVEEYLGNAAVYMKNKDFESLGNEFISIYKNETLHAELKETCKEKAALLSRESFQNSLWAVLETAAHS